MINYIKGIVSIYDNVAQKYVVKNKKNMITNTGREYIMQQFFNNSGLVNAETKISNDRNKTTWLLNACVFGNKNNMTMPTMVYSADDYLADYNLEITPDNVNVYWNDRKIEFTFKLSGKAEAPTNITNLALVTTSSSTVLSNLNTPGNAELFSRLMFTQIPLGAGTSHTITYSVYF